MTDTLYIDTPYIAMARPGNTGPLPNLPEEVLSKEARIKLVKDAGIYKNGMRIISGTRHKLDDSTCWLLETKLPNSDISSCLIMSKPCQ